MCRTRSAQNLPLHRPGILIWPQRWDTGTLRFMGVDPQNVAQLKVIERLACTLQSRIHVGSLGEDVYKIGLTRRLDPLDRVYELSNASVPFGFDVHAMIFSENAPEWKRHSIGIS
jgi:hypothetical protein